MSVKDAINTLPVSTNLLLNLLSTGMQKWAQIDKIRAFWTVRSVKTVYLGKYVN